MLKSEKAGTIYCQRCLAANGLEQEFCGRCGTRLMLVVEPTVLRYEEEVAVADYDEHLLERVSALESRLERIVDRVTRALEVLTEHARRSYLDHILLETLVGVLREARLVSGSRIEKLWRQRFERDAAELAESTRREEMISHPSARFSTTERQTFEGLLRDGLELIDKGRAAQGFRMLERAAALAPENVPLNSFIGEHFFRAGKMTLAHDYLARALAAEPDNRRLCLLLGLVCGDEGDTARAKELLRQSLRGGQLSFAAHYALGRLHAAESDWKTALEEFKEAAAARDCPEARYVLGLVYYQLGRFRTALRHLNKALLMDEEYGEALYLRGLVQLRLGERALASKSFRAARAVESSVKGARKAVGRQARLDDMPAPTLLEPARRGRKRLLTGGDQRIAAALQEDALGSTITR